MEHHTILVVEDEPCVRELAVEVLREEGYDVVEAKDGVEAICALEQHDPPSGRLSLILLDMMLPGVDGLQVLGHLGTLGVSLPVVAVSASRSQLAAALDAGARAALHKPFDLHKFVGTITRHCAARD